MHRSTERGAAMMVAVIFFIVASVFVVLGLTGPSAREYRIASDAISSRQGYASAESGAEDSYYRLRNGMHIGALATLGIPAANISATSTINDLGSGKKKITATGNASSMQRVIELTVSTATGASFQYGLEGGTGGIDLADTSSVNGDVHANALIHGASTAFISGGAISANSPSLVVDQSNGTGTPAGDIVFGDSGTTEDIAESFQLSQESPLSSISLYLKKTGSPTDATLAIVADNSGVPGTTVLASSTLLSSSVASSYDWVAVSFPTNPVLDASTTYWLVVNVPSSSALDYYTIGATDGGYSGAAKTGHFSGTWTDVTPPGADLYFSISLGGLTGHIAGDDVSNLIHIGTGGTADARAHTIDFASVTGSTYCTAGTGASPSCTSATDPVYRPLPISTSEILGLEGDAVSGGTVSSDYTVGALGATIGPKKINGNLTVGSAGTLTVGGTLWVTGNLTVSGGSSIVLDPSYGSGDGIIIVDGTISISGASSIAGSGVSGSYLLLASNNRTNSAISVDGGTDPSAVFYAKNGTVALSGGAMFAAASGYTVMLSGGATETYTTDLLNLNFASGATGSYTIDSWKNTR